MRYVKRQLETVDAVCYKGFVDEDLIEILKDKTGLFYFNYNDLYIYNELNKPRQVKEGEMIICYRSGLLGVLDAESFKSNYKELSNESVKVDLAVSPEPGRLLLN